MRCCGGVRVAKTWPAGDIAGAQECKSKGAPATQLHTCPIKSSKNGQVVRQLHTEAPFVTADSDIEVAGTLVQAVRRTLEAPAVGRGNGRIVIVSNGNAGKGRCACVLRGGPPSPPAASIHTVACSADGAGPAVHSQPCAPLAAAAAVLER